MLPNGLAESSLDAPHGLIQVDTVLDIGAGLRPMPWYIPKRHVCAEPHPAYADRLEKAGYEVVRSAAREALELTPPGYFDAIYLLDVIEHMDRAEGEEVIRLALALEPKQIIVFTPRGFLPQEGDAWGLGAEHWQKHRSGWWPTDFPGWSIEKWDHGHKAFFASWNR